MHTKHPLYPSGPQYHHKLICRKTAQQTIRTLMGLIDQESHIQALGNHACTVEAQLAIKLVSQIYRLTQSGKRKTLNQRMLRSNVEKNSNNSMLRISIQEINELKNK